MPSARLQKVQRYLARYPKATARESARDREYQQYLESLSEEELQALYEQTMRELDNDPEVIARRKRYESMTVEQLTEEIQKALRAS